MLLLAGGTAETGDICAGLLELGQDILLATATDTTLPLPESARLRRVCGRLDAKGFAALIRAQDMRLVICAVHPYASEARENLRRAADICGVPFFCYLRPESPLEDTAQAAGQRGAPIFCAEHLQAAQVAAGFGETILLTTGSRNLAPYVAAARAAGVALFARMLDTPESRTALVAAGIVEDHAILARGPFTAAENIAHIRRCGAGVVISKDGGAAGGMGAKIEAARKCGCRLLVVRRPAYGGESCGTVAELLEAVARRLA